MATVEAGVVLQDFILELAKEGLCFPPDPQSFYGATIGGIIAENAGGPSDGSYVWVHMTIAPIWRANHTHSRHLCMIEDITESKKAEEQLRETTGRLRLATASAKAGVWDWHLQTNEMIWDERMYELYGLTHENFPGGIKAWEQGLHSDDSARTIEDCQAALRGEKDFDTEFRVRHPDGTVVNVKANGLVLRDNKGNAIRMIGLNSDTTERIKAQEEHKVLHERLQRSEKMKVLGQLAGGVAHDLNNVLGVSLPAAYKEKRF